MTKVSWKVTKTVPAPCPDYRPDPYTGDFPQFHCAVYHTQTITEEKSAEFATKEEAEEFIKKAPQNCTDFLLD